MKTTTPFIICLTALLGGSAFAQNPSIARLERGVELMADETTLREAIREFETVMRDEQRSKRLGAEARYHLAECYKTLGDDAKARAQVDKIRSDYANQTTWLAKANALYPADRGFEPIPWKNNEFLVYHVLMPNGNKVGTFFTGKTQSTYESRPTWITVASRPSASGRYFSVSEFDAETMAPIGAKSWAPDFGALASRFEDGGSWEIYKLFSEEILVEGGAGGLSQPTDEIYENDQAMPLMRCLPTKKGATHKIPVVVTMVGSGIIPLELKAEAHEEVTVPEGKLQCVKYSSNINQTFWVELEGARRIVKMDVGGVTIELAKTSHTFPTEASTVTGEVGGSLTMEAPLLHATEADNEKILRVSFLDPKFRIVQGMIEVQPTENFLEQYREDPAAVCDLALKGAAGGAEIEAQVLPQLTGEDADRKFATKSAIITQGKITTKRTVLTAISNGKTLTITLTSDPNKSPKQLLKRLAESWEL